MSVNGGLCRGKRPASASRRAVLRSEKWSSASSARSRSGATGAGRPRRGEAARACSPACCCEANESSPTRADHRGALGRRAAADRAEGASRSTSRSCARRSAAELIETAPPATCSGSTTARSTSTGSSGSSATGRAAARRGAEAAAGARARRSRCGAARARRASRTSPSPRAEIARLEELRLAALELRLEAELALGRARRGWFRELEALVARAPAARAPARGC